MLLAKVIFFQDANYAESLLWTAMGITFLAMAVRRRGPVRRNSLIAGMTLLIFGLSDVVEAQTGAWWRPWPLLAWKGICLLTLLIVGIRAIRLRRSS